MKLFFKAARAVALATSPRFLAVQVSTIPVAVRIFDAEQLKVPFPVRTLLRERRGTKTDFDPPRSTVLTHAGVVHVVQVFIARDGALTQRPIGDALQKGLFTAGFNSCLYQVTHLIWVRLLRPDSRAGTASVNSALPASGAERVPRRTRRPQRLRTLNPDWANAFSQRLGQSAQRVERVRPLGSSLPPFDFYIVWRRDTDSKLLRAGRHESRLVKLVITSICEFVPCATNSARRMPLFSFGAREGIMC